MPFLGPPCFVWFVYPCERRAFVFELGFLGVANLCPSAVTLHDVMEFSFSFGIYLRCLFVRSFDSSFISLPFHNFSYMS